MNKLALRFAFGILLAILISFGLVSYVVLESFERQLEASAPPMAELCLQALVTRLDADGRPVDDARLGEIAREAGMPAARVAADDPSIPASARTAVSSGQPAMAWVDPGFVAVVPLSDGQVLTVGPHVFDLRPTAGDLFRILLAIFSVVGTFAFLLTFPVVRRLQRLERAALALGKGKLATRAPEPRVDDAIGQLTRRFNAMAGQVQTLLEDQQRLVQAVAHEIRTPIARLRFGAEMLDMTQDPADRERRRREIEGDLEELEAMVEELLVYSRYESGRASLDPQQVPIRTSIERLVDKLPGGGPEVVIEPPVGAPEQLLADSRAFNRALRNLLANAARHAETRVRVSWELDDTCIALVVEDDGSGVPEGERERVFQPFARLDAARARESGGVGLGLAIVQRILAAHGGAVCVEESTLGGARFVARWPVDTGR